MSGRPRGFIENWTPHLETFKLVSNIKNIIDTSDILPLTLRQIFYMMVSQHDYDKTEKAYKRLCETMNKARRAQMIDMDSIRDDGLTRVVDSGWYSRNSFLRACRRWAGNFELDRQVRQPIKLYLWCEAGGMVPQLATAVQDYHIPILSSGGFDSVTTKHNFAKEISELDVDQEAWDSQVVILHLGDHDPSGVHMFGSLDEDLQAFLDHYGGRVEMKRIAVTLDQVDELGLPTAPPKSTDKRSFSGQTTQCEAIHPSELKRIVQNEIMEYIDMDIHEETLTLESEISEELAEKFKDLI